MRSPVGGKSRTSSCREQCTCLRRLYLPREHGNHLLCGSLRHFRLRFSGRVVYVTDWLCIVHR